jgi:hypothetical protein
METIYQSNIYFIFIMFLNVLIIGPIIFSAVHGVIHTHAAMRKGIIAFTKDSLY